MSGLQGNGAGKLGRYELIEHLATGGMADVWLANVSGPEGFRKKVVIKILRDHLTSDPMLVDMFIHEARLAAQLNHPYIVQVFDFGAIGNRYFLAMEHVAGATLRQLHRSLVRRRMLMPVPLVVRTLANVCEGLDYAYNLMGDDGSPLRVVHRDVTPENIMLTFSGATKVLDFGIAKANTGAEATEAGVIKGKYAYMAPEQIRAGHIDCRSDLYAVGVVAYELLTGIRPFRHDSTLELMRAILEQPPPPLCARAPWVHPDLEQVVLKALAKEPDDRFQTGDEMSDALDWILHVHEGVPSRGAISSLFAQIFSKSDGPPSERRSAPPGPGGVRPSPGQVVSPAGSASAAAPSTPPAAPSTPPAALSTPPAALSTPPAAPSAPPAAPSAPPAAPSAPPAAPSTPAAAWSKPAAAAPGPGAAAPRAAHDRRSRDPVRQGPSSSSFASPTSVARAATSVTVALDSIIELSEEELLSVYADSAAGLIKPGKHADAPEESARFASLFNDEVELAFETLHAGWTTTNDVGDDAGEDDFGNDEFAWQLPQLVLTGEQLLVLPQPATALEGAVDEASRTPDRLPQQVSAHAKPGAPDKAPPQVSSSSNKPAVRPEPPSEALFRDKATVPEPRCGPAATTARAKPAGPSQSAGAPPSPGQTNTRAKVPRPDGPAPTQVKTDTPYDDPAADQITPSPSAHAWDAAIERTRHRTRKDVARLFEAAPHEVAPAAKPAAAFVEVEVDPARTSGWDLVLESRERARPPQPRGVASPWTVPDRIASSTSPCGEAAKPPGDGFRAPAPDPAAEGKDWFERGFRSYRDGRFREAREAWERACQLAPDNRAYAANLRRLRIMLKSRGKP